MTRRFIRPYSGSADPAARTYPGDRSLPPELIQQAARRLELAGLVLAAAYGASLVLNSVLSTAGWHRPPRPEIHNLIGLTMVAVSAAVVWLARSGRIDPLRLLDLGLVYEIVVAFAIALQDNLAPLSAEQPLNTISWLCVWIVMFPLVVPASPARTLAASVVAASMWPLAFAVGVGLGNAVPAPRIVALNFLENYLAAMLALVPALVIRRLGKDVQRAREMGSYELVELLDRGGMGEVWRARHRMLARPAAIKLVRRDAVGSPPGEVPEALRRRFEREAQATAALQSPHTVELYDFGVTADGTFFYVMELLDGVNLETLVRRFGPLPVERVLHLMLQACDSLTDAHHAGLVHRDVKPANIQVCRRGPRCDFVKVLDFGLVKAWGEADESRLTLEGAVAGTPAYMAPELALGGREVDGRADLYALGCVAYWLVTGRTVFQGATPMQVALQHVQATPVPPSQGSELTVPEGLDRLILSCLEKDPGRRPQTADALARQLAALSTSPGWTQDDARGWWDIHFPLGSMATPPNRA